MLSAEAIPRLPRGMTGDWVAAALGSLGAGGFPWNDFVAWAEGGIVAPPGPGFSWCTSVHAAVEHAGRKLLVHAWD